MKNLFKTLLLALLVIIATDSYAQKKRAKNVMSPEIKEQIESKNYKIRAITALPTGGRSVSVNSNYSIEIKGDSISSNLPYFGRAYSLPYGGGEGLVFETSITDYKIESGKKGSLKIKFEARTKEDNYQFILTIYSNGNSSISVSPGNKQSINFIGKLLTKEDINERENELKKK